MRVVRGFSGGGGVGNQEKEENGNCNVYDYRYIAHCIHLFIHVQGGFLG